MAKKKNRYSQIIETVFFKYYQDGDEEIYVGLLQLSLWKMI
jgi:hypothetical protein